MEKRALLAVVLSIIVLIAYQQWIAPQYIPRPTAPTEEKREEKSVAVTPSPRPTLPETKPLAPLPRKPAKEVKVETDLYVATFTSNGARLKSFKLKRYRTAADKNSPPFEMISSATGVPLPLGIHLNNPQPIDDEGIVYGVQESGLKLTGDARGTLLFLGQSSSGISITKKFTFTGSQYPIDIEVSASGAEGLQPGLLLTSEGTHKGSTKDAAFEGLLTLHDDKVQWITADKIEERQDLSGAISWAGFGYTYFLFAVIPENGSGETLTIEKAGPALVMNLASQPGSSGANSSHYTLFVGPKDLDVLKTVGKGLEKSIYFGYFAFISIPLLYLLHFSHQFTGSYGIDIILLTVFVKILMAPLTHKSFVSMKRMQKLAPQMERIKQKFQNDKEKMNKEIMELYRRNKVNPIGGCLPMLLQFPIFIGLYQALLTPIELRHAPFLWIKDLSQPDWKSLPFALPSWLGGEFGLPVLTLLMGASMFAQQWMTPTAGDPNQRRMMLMMPVIFTVMFVTFPAGLTIYWLVNNVLSIAQQYLINRME